MPAAKRPAERPGSGKTTAQIKSAPQGALFIWHSPDTGYARRLAAYLGRGDLEFSGPSVLDGGGRRIHGRRLSGIVVDHQAYIMLSADQLAALGELRAAIAASGP